ncbi:hypothetical protein PQX77_011469 [Marasmius sp. AFHP31]|nr:hypothetical protein PQX77_011469 [Marasmius sp. AFHP31]
MSPPKSTLTPQRKHRKLLKDGSGLEVWPEHIEAIFVEGLRAYWKSPWATYSSGRSHWRNPYLVEYLRKKGITRSKKQVASHLQVLRNKWKGELEYHLVAGADERVKQPSHPESDSSSSTSSPLISLSSPSSPLPANSEQIRWQIPDCLSRSPFINTPPSPEIPSSYLHATHPPIQKTPWLEHENERSESNQNQNEHRATPGTSSEINHNETIHTSSHNTTTTTNSHSHNNVNITIVHHHHYHEPQSHRCR